MNERVVIVIHTYIYEALLRLAKYTLTVPGVNKMKHWSEDVQEQFGKMVEEGRDLRISTVSKMIKHGISNMDSF